MATLGETVDSTTWINIVSSLSLVVDQAYTLQNVGPTTLLLSEQTSTPISGTPFHEVGPGETKGVAPATGLGIWIQSRYASTTIAITEAD